MEGGHKQSLGGYSAHGLTVATALATSTKNDTPVANLVNSRKKKQPSHTLNQGCKFELKLKKSQLFCQIRKNSMSTKRKRLSRKADLVFLSA